MLAVLPRQLLLWISLLSTLASALPVAHAGGEYAPKLCKISQVQWSNLNASVDGRLHRREPSLDCGSKADPAVPYGDVDGDGTGIYISWAYREYLRRHFGACNSIAQGCTGPEPQSFTPSRSDYREPLAPFYINVQAPSDVVEAFRFSSENGIALSVEDGSNKASAGHTLALRTQSLRSPPVYMDAFVPEGCATPAAGAITLGAGITNQELYEFAETHDRTVVGGFDPDELVSDWVASGGHGPLTSAFGLGVDNVLQIKAVLPDGSYITANECQNRELWFALRGGGANNFGIVIEVTVRALPKVQLEVAYLRFLSSDSDSVTKFTKLCIEHAQAWAKLGWGGFIIPGAMSQMVSGLVLATPRLGHEAAVSSMRELTKFGEARSQMAPNNTVRTVESFGRFYNEYILPNVATALLRTDVAIGSRLIPAAQFSSQKDRNLLFDTLGASGDHVEYPDELTNAMLAPNSSPLTIFLTPPTLFPVDTDSSSVTPAWREATWLVSVAAVVPTEPLPSEYIKANLQAGQANRVLRENLPLSWGAALSEGHGLEPDQAAFWGEENTSILQEIKALVDGEGLLRCESRTCVKAKKPIRDGTAQVVVDL